jgi:EAL domain-containing protein (putative c-di-GMP-specific phosphodiesterase class I)/CheY-like chemotaxis protein
MSATERSVSHRTSAGIRRRWFGTALASVQVAGSRPPLGEVPPSPGRTSPISVLIADDDEMIRQTLIEAIEQADGLAVIATAKDADEAIRIASFRRPDVVLLDVRMPNGGGPRAAREITWRSPRTRIVALSAHDDPRSVDDMLASGATSYLVKDSSLEEIVEAIARAVGGGASLSGSVTEHVASELGSRLALERGLAQERRDKRERIWPFIEGTAEFVMVYQPIVELESGRIVGLEALARFPGEPTRSPDEWFDEAVEVGLGAPLEAAAVRLALPALDSLPDDVFLSVNVDPREAGSPELIDALGRWPAGRIVIELTERAAASDYPRLREALDRLRRSGSRVAVDDAGAGFSSLRHILELGPEIIKLDMNLVRDIDSEPSHRALASALVGFASATGSDLVAEGVETAEEARTLSSLGISLIQGFFAARPGPIPDRFVISLP